MVLIIHIIVALASLLSSTISFIKPSKTKINVTYGLVGMTIVSGTYLVVSTHAPILPSCEAGLIYVGIALSGVLLARHRLARQVQ